jgi:ribosomal protein S18 acetylase RimI-like enzyme
MPENFEPRQWVSHDNPSTVYINGKEYALVHKPTDAFPDQDEIQFIRDEYRDVGSGVSQNVDKALQVRHSDVLRNTEGKIIALCSYSTHRSDNRDILGDGDLSMVVVKKEYRTRSGIGEYLVRRAIENIINAAALRPNFTSPVVIVAQAETEEGANLLRKLEQEYGDKVRFEIEEVYKETEEDSEAEI